ncbi:AraC family transcriptional regulator [Luteibacter sp. OK325]|nr:AraC family transcriptional regulator [Luteibacter sp. OK325]
MHAFGNFGLVDRVPARAHTSSMPRIESYVRTKICPDTPTLAGKVAAFAIVVSDDDTDFHQHAQGQLCFAVQGCTRLTVGDLLCLLPPSRAVWIPPHIPHRTVVRHSADVRLVFYDEQTSAQLPQQAFVMAVSPLMEAIVEALVVAPVDQDWAEPPFDHLIELSLHEIREAPRQPMLLPMPQDRRLAPLMAQPDVLPPELRELANVIGATAKTIGRIFQRETGMSYQQWRQQWRVLRGVEMLVTGQPVSHTSAELGFASDSAFISFFKQMIGCTPGAYLKR